MTNQSVRRRNIHWASHFYGPYSVMDCGWVLLCGLAFNDRDGAYREGAD